MTSSLRVLLDGAIDYAGCFPPAALDVPDAMRRYAAGRVGPHRTILGRLIVAAPQIGAVDKALAGEIEPEGGRELWHLSVIATPPYDETIARIWEFNGRHGATGRRDAVIDSVELKARTVVDVEDAAATFPAGFDLFVEPPLVNTPAGFFESAARSGATAKLRTGGTTPEQIPSPSVLATGMAACHRAGLSFKATAGLHHPLRSDRPLTYDQDGPRAVLHGFLNVLVAAAAIDAEWVDAAGAVEILTETSSEAFQFADDAVAWRAHRLTLADLRSARRFFRSFGSCSIDEPLAGLTALALL
jgi:hypothetical protein